MSSFLALPDDLEREIFELALHDKDTNPIHLLLVARRVHCWLRPFFEDRNMIIDTPNKRYPPNSSTNSIEAYGHLARHLFVEHDGKNDVRITHILNCCPNIRRLTVCGYRPYQSIPILFTLRHITHLSIDMGKLKSLKFHVDTDFKRVNSGGVKCPEDFKYVEDMRRGSTSFFPRVTHLEILGDINLRSAGDRAVLSRFTSLTHLRVEKSDPDVVSYVVEKCLKVLVVSTYVKFFGRDGKVIESPSKSPVTELMLTPELAKVSRDNIVFVIYWDFLAAWEKGATGGEDMWMMADRIVKERQQRRLA
ncbi:hypothetical protein BDN72DRAFT_899212 [Pluteus cervinus]|uniref:Uncharacterized protein n=1 Tax=Pluteus cervinus TaxID=181527 RepID=A0ACD3ANJ0_9AGAR|nr:hypothetical protein BDN72DRAFT_899212 [Pluteus cervinus]